MLEWNDIKLLLAVAHQGSYAKAARHSGVSVATVGRRLRVLERSLGTNLVERRPDGHRLTSKALALIPAASRMAAAAGDLRATLGSGNATVRIIAREWEALFLIRHIVAFRAGLFNIDIELGSKHWPDLTRREADLVLTDYMTESGGVISRELGQMAFAVYASPTYIASNPLALTERRYEVCSWLGLTAAHSYFAAEQWLGRNLHSTGLVIHKFDNAFMLIEAARRGAGLGILPVWLGENEPDLIRVTDVLSDLTHKVSYLMNEDLRHEPRLRLVVNSIVSLFKSERARLAGQINAVSLTGLELLDDIEGGKSSDAAASDGPRLQTGSKRAHATKI